jgi:4a-hydroxytetrahydrobiopterin dehydratase
LTEAEIEDLLFHVIGWQVKEVDGVKRLEKVFKLKNFVEAIEFTNKVAVIAEEQGHHHRVGQGHCPMVDA